MSNQQKAKLGARVLSENELNLILPNAGSVYEQIEVFRSNISSGTEKQQIPEQKTNNIGIMGCRGAGKTSILRTFYEKFKNDKEHKDIILPIIVPENMSSETTLMDVVLGMLCPIVEERKKDGKDEAGRDCGYSGRSDLERSYTKLVRQYCYIKKDYRDILIQQFTTEQYYVDKTKEIFNSDTEFIKQFNEFVQRLLRKKGQDTSDAMIILFIDDIDLSTTKCMDVVKTLLSYLSNPHIVTFISGDMETFEEALTLEFLRQETALDAAVFNETYFSTTDNNDRGKLLERKKLLAYEYLRKIIPPAYRKTIKYWSLEEKGRYQVSDETDDTDKTDKKQMNLMELLEEVGIGDLNRSYFSYNENGKRKCFNVAFHLFDHTSRGLNNVYNVLQDLYVLKKLQEGKPDKVASARMMLEYWRLIETMVDSKPLYAKYKEQLLRQIIVLEREQVRVNFENAYQLLYGGQMQSGVESADLFAIFLLIDFAAGIFAQEQPRHPRYMDLKNEIVKEYLCDERIDEMIASARPRIVFPEEKDKTTIRYILSHLIQQGDFIFDLHLIRYLGREAIYGILNQEGNWKEMSEEEKAYRVASALARAVDAMNETEDSGKNYMVQFCLTMSECMQALLNKLSLDPDIVYGNQLLSNASYNIPGKSFLPEEMCSPIEAGYRNMDTLIKFMMKSSSNFLLAEHEHKNFCYWVYYNKYFSHVKYLVDLKAMANYSFSSGVAKSVMQWMHSVMDGYQIKELSSGSYRFLEGNDKADSSYLELKVIEKIDKEKLWGSPYAKDIVLPYLKRKISKAKGKMAEGSLIFDASGIFELEGGYAKLGRCDKGSSGRALICEFFYWVNHFLFLPLFGENRFRDGKYYMSLDHVLVMQCLLKQFIQNHPRIRYGRLEVNQLLMEMKDLPLVIHTSGWDVIRDELHERENSFFKYCKQNLNDQLVGEMRKQNILEDAIGEIYREYYHGDGRVPVDELLKKYAHGKELPDKVEDGSYYFKYLLQEKRIKTLKESTNLPEDGWNSMEKVISEDECKFIFHSYLRYLQANDSDAARAGTEAELIAAFAKNLLESDAIAEKQRQSDVYEIVSKELNITRDAFENLFV